MALRRSRPPALKRFGQHFLHDRAVLERIAGLVDPSPDETVIEIGPGRGALTDLLAALPNEVKAIEIDRALAASLRERYASRANVTIVEQDVLAVDLAVLSSGPFVVAGNVPYYITTPILFHVLRPRYPRHAVFLLQREVAQRMVAAPGSKAYGALSANVQAVARVEIAFDVPPGAFRPPPKVTSSVVRVVPRADPLLNAGETERFRTFVQALFGMRRKQLAKSLRSAVNVSPERATEVLARAGIDGAERVENLGPSRLVQLMRLARDEA